MYKELLVGCGHRREKLFYKYSNFNKFQNLTTLDNNKSCGPNVVHDLNKLPYPFTDEEFNEIHAYEVLEHCGRQGDINFFFNQFREFYRMLKPKGLFYAAVPNVTSIWAFGDPGHARVITLQSIMFLNKNHYTDFARKNTPQSDYRYLMKNMSFSILDYGSDEYSFWFTLNKD